MSILTTGFGSLFTANSGNVVWAPFADPLPSGAVSTWAEAVAAVQSSTAAETTIYILANPDDFTVIIPAGEWTLNNTTIVGKAVYASYDENFRGTQELLYVHAGGTSSEPTILTGCIGLKDMSFRGNQNDGRSGETTTSFTTPSSGNPVTVTFSNLIGIVEGRTVFLDGPGYYRIDSVNPTSHAVVITNLGLSGNASPDTDYSAGVDVYANNATFRCESQYGYDTTFTLDNCDLHHGGGEYRFATIYSAPNANLFLNLRNGSVVHWYSIRVDGYCAMQSDGSPCWLRGYSFFGLGTVDSFAMPGMYIDNAAGGEMYQWYPYQSQTMYTPGNSGNWDGNPRTILEAIDRLAAACVAAGHQP